jgi:glycosyltransferase involved in cell wall biosynthesis
MPAPEPAAPAAPAVTGKAARRLLTVGHSYVVGLNRRLAHEMARAGAGAGRWEVTAAAPTFFHGDLRDITLQVEPGEPCRVEGVPARFTRKVHVMLYGRALRRLLHSRRWDLVHAWEEPYVLAGGQVARWTPAGVPLVYYLCQNIPKRYPPPFSWVERACRERCAGWIAMGETVAEAQLARGYDRRPHRVLTPGVDPSEFRPDPAAGAAVRRRLGWEPDGPPVVGFLGRLVLEKGLDLLTEALDDVTTPWRALFVGTGPREPALRRWAEKYPGRVAVETGVAHADAPAFVNAMDLLAAPSQTTPFWREQFGRMLIEAFACGVPVVASDSGEIPRVVANAGRVLPESDRAAWSATLAELLDDPAARAELSRRGLERVHARFTWPVIARGHLAFFDELCEAARPDGAPACQNGG